MSIRTKRISGNKSIQIIRMYVNNKTNILSLIRDFSPFNSLITSALNNEGILCNLLLSFSLCCRFIVGWKPRCTRYFHYALSSTALAIFCYTPEVIRPPSSLSGAFCHIFVQRSKDFQFLQDLLFFS